MLRDPEHPSTTATPAGIDNPELSSTAVSPAGNEEDCQPYNGNQPAHQNTPVTLLAQSSDALPPLPPKQYPSHPSHRRANTEIIPQQAPLPSRKLFPDQSKTFEDLDSSTNYSNTSVENTARRRLEEGAKRLSGWFQGKSESVNLGVVYQPGEQDSVATDDMERRAGRDYYGSSSAPTALSNRAQKRMTAPSPLKQVTSSNPFSFFGLKRQGDSRLELPEPAQDEFLNLDINAALFPPGFSNLEGREAFDALRHNADTVLRRLQAAYKQRTFALHEALADKNEKQEELEVTRTRIGNLKVQLDGMAEKVIQQEKAIKAMAEELEHERQLRRREEEARLRSVMLVRSSDDDSTSDLGAELQTPKRSLKRASNGTFTSDSGFDSGDESLAESVFSRREGLESPASTVAPSPNISQITLSTPTPTAPVQPNQKELKPAPTPALAPTPTLAPAPTPARPSTYDRVLKGLTPKSIANSWTNSSKCNICHGIPASEAWSVMGILKEENKGLKERLGELENVIDDCLCLIGP